MESDMMEYNQTFSEFSNSSTDSQDFSEEVESESINEEEFFNQVPPSEPARHDCMDGPAIDSWHTFFQTLPHVHPQLSPHNLKLSTNLLLLSRMRDAAGRSNRSRTERGRRSSSRSRASPSPTRTRSTSARAARTCTVTAYRACAVMQRHPRAPRLPRHVHRRCAGGHQAAGPYRPARNRLLAPRTVSGAPGLGGQLPRPSRRGPRAGRYECGRATGAREGRRRGDGAAVVTLMARTRGRP